MVTVINSYIQNVIYRISKFISSSWQRFECLGAAQSVCHWRVAFARQQIVQTRPFTQDAAPEEPLSELSTPFLERVQTSQHQWQLIIAVRKCYHHRPSLNRLQRLRPVLSWRHLFIQGIVRFAEKKSSKSINDRRTPNSGDQFRCRRYSENLFFSDGEALRHRGARENFPAPPRLEGPAPARSNGTES